MKRIVSVLLLLFVFFTEGSAVISKDGKNCGPVESFKPFGTTQVYDSKIKAMKAISKPISGTLKIAVVLVNFPTAGNNTSGSITLSPDDIRSIKNSIDYMKGFYSEVSYGKVSLNVTYFDMLGTYTDLTGSETPLTVGQSMSYYGTGDESGDAAKLAAFATESIQLVGSALNSSAYDIVMIAHAGYGNESTDTTLYKGDLWSVQIRLANKVNGFDQSVVIAAKEDNSSPIGVICHEFGHALGLPDVYDSITQNVIVGKWCLMDYGPWTDNGFHPPHPSAWCKKYLGWITPEKIARETLITGIKPVEISSSSVYQFDVLGSSTEYFLVCYSTKSAYNSYSPGGGFLVWHVDEGVISGKTFAKRLADNEINSYAHPTLDIECASKASPRNSPFGTASDPWPGDFKVFKTTASDSYSGKASSIAFSQFAFSGGTAEFFAGTFNTSPEIDYAGGTFYQNSAVSPAEGNAATQFTYKIEYFDADNDAPKSGYPKLYIKNSGVNISGSPFAMFQNDLTDTVYNDGKFYYYSTVLPSCTSYTYFFEAYDVLGATATTLFSQPLTGPKVFEASQTVYSNTAAALNLETDKGSVKVDVPAGTFGSSISLRIVKYTTPETGEAQIKTTGICFDVQKSIDISLQKNVLLTFSYSNSDAAAFDKKRFYIARYDSSSAKWIVLNTTNNSALNQVSAYTDHLSIFALVQLVPSEQLDTVSVFPNPFYPSRDSGIVVENVSDDTIVRVFTMSGELIKRLEVASNGRATWDGLNFEGKPVASGIYMISVKNEKYFKVYKLAIIK